MKMFFDNFKLFQALEPRNTYSVMSFYATVGAYIKLVQEIHWRWKINQII